MRAAAVSLAVACLVVTHAVAQQQTVYEAGPGITLPRVVKEVKPQYTRKAMDERVQGTVWLGCVVATNGRPTDITVTKALHPDLDEAAVDALEQWQFKPGSKDGEPVPVRITVELTFTLK